MYIMPMSRCLYRRHERVNGLVIGYSLVAAYIRDIIELSSQNGRTDGQTDGWTDGTEAVRNATAFQSH